MRQLKQASTEQAQQQQTGAVEDYTLAGYESVLPKVQHTRGAAYFLDPIRTTHHVNFGRSASTRPADAFEELFSALASNQISALDLAESIVASRPTSANDFKLFLRSKLHTPSVVKSHSLREAITECILEVDSLIAGHVRGDFQDALYRKSLEALINYSGVLGELGEPGLINGDFYGAYCRRYDRIQARVLTNGGLYLHGFSTESWQLEKVYDLIADLKGKGIITQSIGMSREEFARSYQMHPGEIAKRGAYAAVGAQLASVGISIPSHETYAIHPNSSSQQVFTKIMELMSALHEESYAETVQALKNRLDPEVANDLDEALKSLISNDIPPERIEHFRWMLEELHQSLYLRYRARFHNDDRSIISDDGTITFDVMVDHHREDYAGIFIDCRSVAPDAYQKIASLFNADELSIKSS